MMIRAVVIAFDVLFALFFLSALPKQKDSDSKTANLTLILLFLVNAIAIGSAR